MSFIFTKWRGTEGGSCTSSLQASYLDLGRLALLDKWPQAVCETGLPRWLSGKECACQCRRHGTPGFYLWVRKVPWKRKRQPAPVFFLGESNGQRILGVLQSIRLQRAGSEWTRARTHNVWNERRQGRSLGVMKYGRLETSLGVMGSG